jgi:spermidine synthase
MSVDEDAPARAASGLPAATISESDGVRFLHLGSIWVQGAMRIRKPQVVELVYVQRMLASLLWLPQPEWGEGHALQLGLGAGAITRFTHKALRMPTTVVELNPQVVAAGRLWFHLPAEVEVAVGDAGRWLRHSAAPASVRLLHVDLYDQEAAAPVLDDEAFYAACRAVLDDGGVMSVNLFGRHASFAASAARIAAVFGASRVWSVQPTREGNTVVIAARTRLLPEPAELAARAAAADTRFAAFGLAARKWPRMIRPWHGNAG